jgi:hypothetical protein
MDAIMELDDPISTSGDHSINSKNFFSDSKNCSRTLVGQVFKFVK